MKRGATDHPKLYVAAELAGIRRPQMIGHLELLWHFAARYAPAGDIGRFDDRRIEAALDWCGRPGRLLYALVQGGWVESSASHRLVIHDWHDHADESVRVRLKRAKIPFASIQRDTDKVSGENPTLSRSVGEKKPLPMPVPEPVPVPEPIPAARRPDADTTPTRPPDTGPLDDTPAQVVERMLAAHPKKAGKTLAEQELAERLKPLPPEKQRELLTHIEQRHLLWCRSPDWRRDGGRYAPKLANWIHDGGERDDPPPEDESPPKHGLAVASNGKPQTFGELRQQRQDEIFERLMAREMERKREREVQQG